MAAASMAMRLAGRGSRALLLSGHELRRPLVTLRLPPPLAACGTLAGRGSRGAVGSATAQSARAGTGPLEELPENLRKIMDDYERKMDKDEDSQGFVQRLFLGKHAAVAGIFFASTIMYLMNAIDDVTSELHHCTSLLLRILGPEAAQRFLLRAAAWGCLPSDYDKDDPYLIIEPQEGLRFFTPVGLASGFDVGAVGPNAFLNLGFGFVEVGPVEAADAEALGGVRQRLAARDRTDQVVHLGLVGACIRGSTSAELLGATEVLGAYVDYITLDLGPLPKAARVESALGRLVLDVVSAANSVPGGGPAVFLKVPAGYPARAARDTERVEAAGSAAAAALFGGAAGIILAHGEDEELADSGAAAELLSEVYRRTDGRLTLIASGGVRTGREALGLIEAGATVIQISHLLVSEGPQVCRRLKSEMSQALMERNYVSLQDAVGAAHRKKKVKRRNPWKAIGA
mmetsp:Transcript_66474/g.171920  ORF Transcript_66474/g.171920 Transcript_66474/m.171920 type:complete len:458 (+) Transcript_66474:61-1434(+)